MKRFLTAVLSVAFACCLAGAAAAEPTRISLYYPVAVGGPGDRDKTLTAGMNDHIGKPLNVGELFAVLARWILPRRPAADSAGTAAPEAQDPPAVEGLDIAGALARLGGGAALAGALRELERVLADSAQLDSQWSGRPLS